MRTLLALLAVGLCADATPWISASAYCPNGPVVGPSSSFCSWEDRESAYAKAYFDYHGWYPGGDAFSSVRLSAEDNVLSAVTIAFVSSSYGLMSSGWLAYAGYEAMARTSGAARPGIVKFKTTWSARSGAGIAAGIWSGGSSRLSPMNCPNGFGAVGLHVYSCDWQSSFALGEASPFLIHGRSLPDPSMWWAYGRLGQLKEAIIDVRASFFEADGITPVSVSFVPAYTRDEALRLVPEPATVGLVCVGLAALAVKRRKKRPSPGVEST